MSRSARHCHVGDFQVFVALGPAQPLQDLFAGHQLFTCAAAFMDTDVAGEQNKRMYKRMQNNGKQMESPNINGSVLQEQSIGLVDLVLKLRWRGWEAAFGDGKAKGGQKDAKAKSIHFYQSKELQGNVGFV